jgi:small multidrug resistance family-3 protein
LPAIVEVAVFELKTIALFVITAIAEIVGCYLPYLWLREDKSIWLLIPGALSLALFVWLLTLHPTAAGRVYAAYGGVYVSVALLWLWAMEGVRLSTTDVVGVSVMLIGMSVIMFSPRGA